nr:glycoside hydrolase family protein [Massilia sp. REN29]
MVDQEFERKIAKTEAIIHRNITVALHQAQFDELCSLAYNAGANGSSQTFRLVNRGDFNGAANNMSLMIKVRVVEKGKKKLVIAPGLIKRRAEESAPFRTEKSTTAVSE